MSNPASPVRALRKRLAKLRLRVRAFFAVQGAARWVAAAVLTLLLFFLADWILNLPIGVRQFVRLGLLDRPANLADPAWILLLGAAVWLTVWSTRARLGAAPLFAFAAGGIVGVLVWLAVRLIAPVRLALSDEELALSVEHRFQRLNDRLAAALDFEKELAQPTRGESQDMMRVVLDEAEQEARGLEFSRAVSARRALAWSGVALIALVLAAGVGLAASDTVELWAERSLLLEDREWPRETTLRAVDVADDSSFGEHPAAVPYEVAIGRTLEVHAHAEGEVPDEVILFDRVEGVRPLPTRMVAVPERPGLFRVEIRDVRRPFAFVLKGGDDLDELPLYRVEVTVPPRVLALRARLAFPSYLGRPEETVEGGNLEVPEDTAVTLAFETDVPISQARLTLLDEVLEALPTGSDDRHFQVTFEARETARYRILLRSFEGRESDPAADTYEIRVKPDQPPRLTWIHPRGAVETTPRGRVPLLAVAEDDHSVSGIEIDVKLPDETVRERVALRPWDEAATGADDGALPALDGAEGRPEIRVYLPLEIEALKDTAGVAPSAPARLAVRLRARDSKGQTKESTWASIDVYGAVDVERALTGRRGSIRSELTAVLEEQRRRREQLQSLEAATLEAPERDLLRSIQFAQAKIVQDLDGAVRGLLEIFNAWVYGRLGAETPTAHILSILDRYHRSHYGRPIEDAPDGAVLGDPAFPYAVFDEIVRAWRDRVIFDTGLLEQMLRVVADAVDVAARKAPRAHAAVADAVTDAEGPETEQRLRVALAAQDATIEVLERMLVAMQSWQGLNDVILQIRRVVEEQEALNERLEAE